MPPHKTSKKTLKALAEIVQSKCYHMEDDLKFVSEECEFVPDAGGYYDYLITYRCRCGLIIEKYSDKGHYD